MSVDMLREITKDDVQELDDNNSKALAIVKALIILVGQQQIDDGDCLNMLHSAEHFLKLNEDTFIQLL